MSDPTMWAVVSEANQVYGTYKHQLEAKEHRAARNNPGFYRIVEYHPATRYAQQAAELAALRAATETKPTETNG